jgi:hypothetical protein
MDKEKKTEQKGEQIALETRQQQPIPQGWQKKWLNRQSRIEDRWRNRELGD